MAYYGKNHESAPLFKEISDAFATLQNYQHLLQQNQPPLATARQAGGSYGHSLSTNIDQQVMQQQNFMQSQPIGSHLQNMNASDMLRLRSGHGQLQTPFATRELNSNIQSEKVRDNFLSELANSMRLANSNLSASEGLGHESSYNNLQTSHLSGSRARSNLPEISSVLARSINTDEEDAFLYGSEEDKLPLRSRFPQRQHASDNQERDLALSHSYGFGDKLPIQQPVTSAAVASSSSQQGNVLHDILQSLGFDFEKSRQNQEKAKMREEIFTVKESETFLGGNANFNIDEIPQETRMPKQAVLTKKQQPKRYPSAVASTSSPSTEECASAGKMQASDVAQREKFYQKIVETLTAASEALLSKKMKLQLCMVSDEDRTRKSKAIKRGRSIEQFRECKTALFSLYTLHQEMVKIPAVSRDNKLMEFIKQITLLMRQLTDRLRLLEDNVEKIGKLLGLPDSLVGLYNVDSRFFKENKVIQTLILQSRQAAAAKSRVGKPPAKADVESSGHRAASHSPEREPDQSELLKLPLALLGASKYWCKPCTAILRSVKELLTHLHDGQHYENTKEYFQPWLPTCAKTNIPVVALKGRIEDVHCQLCQLDVKEPEKLEEHFESQYHRILCEKFVIECLCTDQVVSATKPRQEKSTKSNLSKSTSESFEHRSKLPESHGRHYTEHRSPRHSYSHGWHEPELQMGRRSCSPDQPAHQTYRHVTSPQPVSQVDDHLWKSQYENVRHDVHTTDISHVHEYDSKLAERQLSSEEQYTRFDDKLEANKYSHRESSPVISYRQVDRQSSFTSREGKLPYQYRASANTNYPDSDSISHGRHRTSPENRDRSSQSKSRVVQRHSPHRSRSRGRFRSRSKSRDFSTYPVEKRPRERSRSFRRSLERHQRLRSRSRHRRSRSFSPEVSRSLGRYRHSELAEKENESGLHGRHNRSRSRETERRHRSRSREAKRRHRSRSREAKRRHHSRSWEAEQGRHSRSRGAEHRHRSRSGETRGRLRSRSRDDKRHHRSRSGETKQRLRSRSRDDKRYHRSRSREVERHGSKSQEAEQRQPSESREAQHNFHEGNNIQISIKEKNTQARTEEKSKEEANMKETESVEVVKVPDGEMSNVAGTASQKGEYVKDGTSSAHSAGSSEQSLKAIEDSSLPLDYEVAVNKKVTAADNQMPKTGVVISVEQLALENVIKSEKKLEAKVCEEVSDEELIVVDKSEEEIIGESCEVVSDKELSSENEIDIMKNESEMISDEDLDTELNSDAVLKLGEYISDDDMSGGELLFEEVSDEECPESCEEISDAELPVDDNTSAENYVSIASEKLDPDLKICMSVMKKLITKVTKMTETGVKLKQKWHTRSTTRSQLSKKRKIEIIKAKTLQGVTAVDRNHVDSQSDDRKFKPESNPKKRQQLDSIIEAELEFMEAPDLAMLMELADGEELIDIDELSISDEEKSDYAGSGRNLEEGDKSQEKISERKRHNSDKHKSVHDDHSSRSKYSHNTNKTSSSDRTREKSKSGDKTKTREKYEEQQDLREYLDSRKMTQQRLQDITEKIRSEPDFDKRILLRRERSKIAKEFEEEQVRAFEKRKHERKERWKPEEKERKLRKEKERKLCRKTEEKERKLRKEVEEKERKLRRNSEEKQRKRRREAEEKGRALERAEKEKLLEQKKLRKTVAHLRSIYGRDLPLSDLPPGTVPYPDTPSANRRENTIKREELRRSQDLEIRYLEEKQLQSYLDLDFDLWFLRTGPLLSCAKGEASGDMIPEDDNSLQPPGIRKPPLRLQLQPQQPILSFVAPSRPPISIALPRPPFCIAPTRPIFSIAPPPPFGLLDRFTRDRSLVHIQTKPE